MQGGAFFYHQESVVKKCSRCGEKKPRTEFYVSRKSRAKDGLQSHCKSCTRAYDRERVRCPESRWRIEIKRRYGLTVEDFQRMFQAQAGRCAICHDPFVKRPHVDHCHSTGRVRGLLCRLCNVSLGGFRDNPKLLQRAIDYLAR